MDLEKAVEVFVTAFTAGKSLSDPYVAHRVDGLWVMRDEPARKYQRKIEVIATGLEPAAVVERIRSNGIGWHFLCDIHPTREEFDARRAAYKGLGYRAMATEWMFAHTLQEIPHFESEPPVRQLMSQAEMDGVPQPNQRRKFVPTARHFAIWNGEKDLGWVQSISVEDATWAANLFVRAEERRKGYGRALMSRLLETDRQSGSKTAVLLASSAGAKLYPLLGYEQIGILQMFCPATR